jgi:GH35 family endo-1,4-beta-xylanase
VRDWSLKWKDVEPEKGRFTFREADLQIDRPREHGLRVLAMLPFPSSPWSSTAPASAGARYEERRSVIARAPRDMAEFENYVEGTVDHYRGRITWYQVFNEHFRPWATGVMPSIRR